MKKKGMMVAGGIMISILPLIAVLFFLFSLAFWMINIIAA